MHLKKSSMLLSQAPLTLKENAFFLGVLKYQQDRFTQYRYILNIHFFLYYFW